MPLRRIGSGGIAPRILDIGTRWRWVVSFTLRPLYPQEKIPWYSLDRSLDGPQSRSEHGGEEKEFPAPAGTRTPDHPAYNTLYILRNNRNHNHRLSGGLSSSVVPLCSANTANTSSVFRHACGLEVRECIQKFPDWVDNEIYAYNNKQSLRSDTKGYGGKTH
jgi:hypothetical protein